MDEHAKSARPKTRTLSALAFAAAISSACATFSTHLTPRPTAEGQVDFNANIDVHSFVDDDGTRAVLPNVELVGRYGILDTWDVGVKFNAFGAELNSRLAVLLSDGLDLGIVPAVGVLARSDATGHRQLGLLTFTMPALAGVHLSEDLTLVFGAKLVAHISTIPTKNDADVVLYKSGEVVLFPGGVLGLEAIFSDNFSLFPELDFLFPYLIDYTKFARPIWQGGIAFQFRFGR